LSRDEFGSGTPDRILDTAEELFTRRGIAATSLRTLTRKAAVNLAAVHYYFGSKDALLDAVIERRATLVNRQRIAQLDRLCDGGASRPQVEAILGAFLSPGPRRAQALGERTQVLTRLLARIHAEAPELVESLTRKHFGEVMQRFVEALQGALPEIPADEVANRFRFSVGALLHVVSSNFELDSIPGHPVRVDDEDCLARQLTAFLAAGLRAPACAKAEEQELRAVAR